MPCRSPNSAAQFAPDARSAVKPAMGSESAAKHASMPMMPLVVAYYNPTWDKKRLRYPRLNADIKDALNAFTADLVLLSECGEAGIGLDRDKWLPLLRRICGDGYAIEAQGHYTSIVKTETIEFTPLPSLKGPLSTLRSHGYRMCQHMQVIVKGT